MWLGAVAYELDPAVTSHFALQVSTASCTAGRGGCEMPLLLCRYCIQYCDLTSTHYPPLDRRLKFRQRFVTSNFIFGQNHSRKAR